MHGYERQEKLATCFRPVSQSPSDRCGQRPAASRPMGDGCHEHGQRLADPPQPPAGQRQHPCRTSTDLESICAAGCGNSRQQEGPRSQERMVSMGESEGQPRESVHSEEKAELVETTVPQGMVSVENVLRLLAAQQYRCALTGRRLEPQAAALDHVVPIRFGGEHLIENAQVLHKDVNRAKGSLTNEEFIGMCREVVCWFGRQNTRKGSL